MEGISSEAGEKDFFDKLRDLYLKEDGNIEQYEVELPILREAIDEIRMRLQNSYELLRPVGRGGAGIVIQVKDIQLGLDRALKLPRPKEAEIMESVKHEMEHLVKIRHENVIAIHTLGEVQVRNNSYPFFVMDFIDNATDLRKYLMNLTTTINCLDRITEKVASIFYDIARAIYFLHEKSIIHFDVKPGNILIDSTERPILGDLGYAKSVSTSDTAVIVGFTLFYAHPELTAQYHRGSSENRIRKPIAPKAFNYVWDIYAFGKTLLEALSIIDRTFPEAVSYDKTFLSLHLAACRMLDGKNLSDDQVNTYRFDQTKEGPLSYWETWAGLSRLEFRQEGLKYDSFKDVLADLQKLFSSTHITLLIPELDLYNPQRIQCSHGAPAPFTKRAKLIVEHPIFTRLSYFPHLSLMRHIYPTATHTRLEHSIGVFRNCCQYIRSLTNDAFNPFFQQVMNDKDLKCLLLASLLHDLGHYPLAHILEEIESGIDHIDLTIELIDSPVRDYEGHTLKEIIENSDWGWGVSTDCIKKLLGFDKDKKSSLFSEPTENIKMKTLASIISGPIDVDKLDYLIRDSHECYLRYGMLIDFERLISNLTVIIGRNSQDKCEIEIGVYDKGQSAAESLIFARYLLYQSVYWHHTSRSIRAMLHEAFRRADSKPMKRGSFIALFKALIDRKSDVNYITENDVINFLEKYTDETGKMLIDLIKKRQFYKRILTIHEEIKASEEGKHSFLDLFRQAYSKSGFRESLHKELYEQFSQAAAAKSDSHSTMLTTDNISKAKEILFSPESILIDIPSPSYGSAMSLRLIPEPQRLQRNYLTRKETGERISEVWANVHHKLMRFASKGRIYCHPDIRETLMAVLRPEDIRNILDTAIHTHIK